MSDLDYSNLKLPPVRDTRVFSGKLSDLDYAKLKVMSKLNNEGLAGFSKTALSDYVSNNWENYLNELRVKATQENLTAEEYFTKLLDT